jgi:hypothetical protein
MLAGDVRKSDRFPDQGSTGSIRYRCVNLHLMIRVQNLQCSRHTMVLHCSVAFADKSDEIHGLWCHDYPERNIFDPF